MIKYNKNIQQFIKNNNINVNYFECNNEAILFNKYDINKITAKWGIYKNKKQEEVNIADVIGKSMYKSRNILLELNELFDETADQYQKRSISMLEYSEDNIINELKDSFSKDFITLTEIENGKYIIKDNGMHRCSLIRTFYLNELSKNNDIKSLKDKYKIVAIVERLDTVKTYCSYLLYFVNKNIIIEQELDKNYRKTDKVILKNEADRRMLNNKQLIKYVKDNICHILPEYLKNDIVKVYLEDEAFKQFIDKNLKGTIIEKAIKEYY